MRSRGPWQGAVVGGGEGGARVDLVSYLLAAVLLVVLCCWSVLWAAWLGFRFGHRIRADNPEISDDDLTYLFSNQHWISASVAMRNGCGERCHATCRLPRGRRIFHRCHVDGCANRAGA